MCVWHFRTTWRMGNGASATPQSPSPSRASVNQSTHGAVTPTPRRQGNNFQEVQVSARMVNFVSPRALLLLVREVNEWFLMAKRRKEGLGRESTNISKVVLHHHQSSINQQSIDQSINIIIVFVVGLEHVYFVSLRFLFVWSVIAVYQSTYERFWQRHVFF